MKKLILVIFINLLLIPASFARDDIGSYAIADALAIEEYKNLLGNEIRFYCGTNKPKNIQKIYGEFGTNKKTNAFNKTDKAACQRAFISALISLRDRALREGGNAVINVKSNYKGTLTSDNTTFRCGAGAIMAGVALVGTVAQVK